GLAGQPRLHQRPVEQGRESLVEHVEAAGIGAEGRHYQPTAVGGEAFPPDPLPPPRDARNRMQMAGDLRRTAQRWLVAQGDAADHQRAADKAADAFGQVRIVIAEDPVPVAALLQHRQLLAITAAQPACELAAVKAVAERNHPAWPKMVEAGGKALQGA